MNTLEFLTIPFRDAEVGEFQGARHDGNPEPNYFAIFTTANYVSNWHHVINNLQYGSTPMWLYMQIYFIRHVYTFNAGLEYL